jgi:hypothetical protein
VNDRILLGWEHQCAPPMRPLADMTRLLALATILGLLVHGTALAQERSKSAS